MSIPPHARPFALQFLRANAPLIGVRLAYICAMRRFARPVYYVAQRNGVEVRYYR